VVAAPRAPKERLVLLDANALVSAVRLKIDLAQAVARVAPGWTPVVPTCVARELEGLGERQHAAGARALAGRFASLPALGRGDAALRAAAKAGPLRAVATNDRKLRAQLRREGVTILFIRGRHTLAVDGALGGRTP
jgi:rRNA-processing protein FCF1